MIVCSCNVFSDSQVRAAIASAAQRPRMSRVYASLGCVAKCGGCAHTIKKIIDETKTAPMSSGCAGHLSSEH
jgi:bacterioferritin-associated ferredoxin